MYKYVTEDNLEQPQTYMYTEYYGREFLRNYRMSRENFLSVQLEGSLEDFWQMALEIDGWLAVKLKTALEAVGSGNLMVEAKDELEFLVKVFELRKRLYSEYPHGYKPNETSDYRRYDYYILLGNLLCQAYKMTDNLKYLNTLLKLDDTLLSLCPVFDERQKRCTAALLRSELGFVDALAGQQGLTM